MTPLTDLGDTLAGLTAADARDLLAYLKTHLGVEPPTAVAVLPKVKDVPPPTPTEFNVVLESVELAKKLAVIRTIRELTSQGLAEAKAMAESYPRVVQTGVDGPTAERTKKKLEDAGAKVAIQPA